jgi:formamidopyrimidine-DNA glycosylase
MPEAPDTYLIAEYLQKHYLGLTIESVRCNDSMTRVKDLIGYTMETVSSHGKELYFTWKCGDKMLYSVAHLMLQGRFYNANKHTQEVGHYFTLRFSTEVGIAPLSMYDHMGIAKFTVEVEAPEKTGICVMSGNITEDDLIGQFGNCSIASALMRQQTVKGIGLYLAEEVLDKSDIHPSRKCNTLTNRELELLTAACNEVPQYVLSCGSFHHARIVSPDGTPGYFVSSLSQGNITKIKIGGRTFRTRQPSS